VHELAVPAGAVGRGDPLEVGVEGEEAGVGGGGGGIGLILVICLLVYILGGFRSRS